MERSVALDHCLNELHEFGAMRPRVHSDVIQLFGAAVVDLVPSVSSGADAGVPQCRSCLSLDGTLAIQYQHNSYNLPVALYLLPGYPDAPPRMFVRPTPNMEIRSKHRHVDAEGAIYLPYLSEWDSHASSLVELCVTISSVFEKNPPLFARPPTPEADVSPPSHQQLVASRAPNVAGGSRPPPPSYDSVSTYDSIYPATTTTTTAGNPSPAQSTRESARESVTLKLQQRMAAFFETAREEIDAEFKAQIALQACLDQHLRPAEDADGFDGGPTETATLKDRLGLELRAVREKTARVEAWATAQEQRRRTDAEACEPRAEPADRLSAQLLDALTESAAIEDALFSLDQALAENHVDIDTFLREVRRLSRIQFLRKALVLKLHAAIDAAQGPHTF